jgi:general stress protein 26
MDTQETRLKDQEAIKKLKELVDEVSICMFTTIDDDNNVTSRPMYTSSIDEEGNLWFFTNEFSEKISELSKDNLVHLIYSHPVKNIYVDVKGSCSVIIDKTKMEELWDSKLQSWVPEGLDDARLCLVKVTTDTAYFWNHSYSKMGLLFHMIRSITKGDKYKESERGKLDLTPREK